MPVLPLDKHYLVMYNVSVDGRSLPPAAIIILSMLSYHLTG